MISRIFNITLALIFLTLVALFTYKSISKPTNVSDNLTSENAEQNHSLNRSEVEQIIREYLQNNPEDIIRSLEDFQNKSQEKQKIEESQKTDNFIKANKNELQTSLNPPTIGNPNADVKIVTFFDYNCSYCKKSSQVDQELLASDGNVQIILRPIPILGERSNYAIKASLAVWMIAPDKFANFHNEMMTAKTIDEDFVKTLLTKYEIDAKTIEEKMSSTSIDEVIAQNFEFAKNIGVRGTPSYLVNEQFVPGLLSIENMKQLIMMIRGQK